MCVCMYVCVCECVSVCVCVSVCLCVCVCVRETVTCDLSEAVSVDDRRRHTSSSCSLPSFHQKPHPAGDSVQPISVQQIIHVHQAEARTRR